VPKKLSFETDLVRINITRKAHAHLVLRKQRGEPLYRVFDRMLISHLDNDADDWQQMYYEQVETTKNWIKKYNQLKDWGNSLKKAAGYQETIV
jgi:hypothetical protein